jgi:cell division protein FtsB
MNFILFILLLSVYFTKQRDYLLLKLNEGLKNFFSLFSTELLEDTEQTLGSEILKLREENETLKREINELKK